MKLTAKLLLYATMMLFVACGAQAHEPMHGEGIVCDEQGQLETYYGLTGHGVSQPKAIQLINTDAQSNVCVIATVLYHRGKTLTTIPSANGHIDIVQILVTAFLLNNAWHVLPPTIQYTGFYSMEEPA